MNVFTETIANLKNYKMLSIKNKYYYWCFSLLMTIQMNVFTETNLNLKNYEIL